jgi:hypothetical protein
MVVEVGLFFLPGKQPGEEGIWYAEWAQPGAAEAIDDLGTDLASLVAGIVDDVRRMGWVSLIWRLQPGDVKLSSAQTRQLVKEAGVTLPEFVGASRGAESATA